MEKVIFKKIQPTIPTEPGIYQYFDEKGILLYVGKAKNLRNRVSSYFSSKQLTLKTIELVQKIKDGSTYFGPYTNVLAIRELMQHVKQSIPLRTCTLPLDDKSIVKKKYKVCLEYHLGNCKGPCEGLQSIEDYNTSIDEIKHVLKGNIKPIIHGLKTKMQDYAKEMAFEKANLVKKKIEDLEQYNTKSVVYIKQLHPIDVFSIAMDEDQAYVNYLMIQDGRIIQTHMLPLSIPIHEEKEEILSFAINYFREHLESGAKEIIIPFEITPLETNIKYTIPKAGEKEQLLALSQKNADFALQEFKRRQSLIQVQEVDMNETLEELQESLQLQEIPYHIECFDNSNFQGSYPVSAMVCFKNGFPSKSDYRKFNIKTVKGINDFASMKEAVTRRYQSVIEKKLPLPQLIIIDGGKGQLNAAIEALQSLSIQEQVTTIGLAKNIEEVFFPGDSKSILLNWHSPAHKLLRNIRDEVHRFGIQFHRSKRSKGAFETGLDNIPGIGPKTKEQLLLYFKSANKVRAANPRLLEEIVGKQKANILMDYFKNNN